MSITFNTPTPLQNCRFRGIDFLLKRDDLLHPDFSGNKARKIDYFVNNIPPEIEVIVSYGSIQSNAMYSISAFATAHNLGFRYYANHIPSLLKEHPQGNMELVLRSGAQIIEGYDKLSVRENELFIKEGIACKEAYFGIKKLALELADSLDSKEYQIFLPSGTGTTALYLSKSLQVLGAKNISVFTTACVGESSYLMEQFKMIEPQSKYYPKIIETSKRYHYGKLYADFYQIWLELHKETNIEFELLYDPKGWIAILENQQIFENLVYIHQGGVLGNSSMLARYKRKYGESV